VEASECLDMTDAGMTAALFDFVKAVSMEFQLTVISIANMDFPFMILPLND
jgi:hypothetical protein